VHVYDDEFSFLPFSLTELSSKPIRLTTHTLTSSPTTNTSRHGNTTTISNLPPPSYLPTLIPLVPSTQPPQTSSSHSTQYPRPPLPKLILDQINMLYKHFRPTPFLALLVLLRPAYHRFAIASLCCSGPATLLCYFFFAFAFF
jgi:hypothetical protein